MSKACKSKFKTNIMSNSKVDISKMPDKNYPLIGPNTTLSSENLLGTLSSTGPTDTRINSHTLPKNGQMKLEKLPLVSSSQVLPKNQPQLSGIYNKSSVTPQKRHVTLNVSIPDVNLVNPDDDQTHFSVYIHDGYTFKSLMAILANTQDDIVFNLYENRMECFVTNEENTLTLAFAIKIHVLTEYSVSTNKEYPIRLSFKGSEFNSKIKQVRKKGSIKLFKQKGQLRLFFQIMIDGASTSDDSNLAYIPIRILSYDNKKYAFPKYKAPISKPNCSVLSRSLSTAYNALTKDNYQQIVFKMYPKGFTIDARTSNNTGNFFKYGDIPLKGGNYIGCSIGPEILKNLSKVETLSANGTTQIYAEANKPIMQITSVGDYGVLRIYIKPIRFITHELPSK